MIGLYNRTKESFNARAKQSASGFTLIEVLVSMLLMAIGLLGLAGLQISSINNQFEAYQRLRALLLVEDMASRIQVNPAPARAAAYAVGSDYGRRAIENCTAGASLAQRDLCEWNVALAGADTQLTGAHLGSIAHARGCLANPAPSGDGDFIVRITVAWLGRAPTSAPSSACGRGQYGSDDSFRRTISQDVVLANLAL